jgi:hypothetical protein
MPGGVGHIANNRFSKHSARSDIIMLGSTAQHLAGPQHAAVLHLLLANM